MVGPLVELPGVVGPLVELPGVVGPLVELLPPGVVGPLVELPGVVGPLVEEDEELDGGCVSVVMTSVLVHRNAVEAQFGKSSAGMMQPMSQKQSIPWALMHDGVGGPPVP